VAAVERVVRPQRVFIGTESELLWSDLDYHRATLLWKCEGLDDAQLRSRAVPASSLTLLDLLRHAAGAERHWFQSVPGLPVVEPHYQWVGGWYDPADPTPPADVVADFSLACDESRRVVASLGLDEVFDSPEFGRVTFRFIAIHMIEEYGRHCGHADLIRESIDGAVGE
jgi:hypothetical protein